MSHAAVACTDIGITGFVACLLLFHDDKQLKVLSDTPPLNSSGFLDLLKPFFGANPGFLTCKQLTRPRSVQ